MDSDTMTRVETSDLEVLTFALDGEIFAVEADLVREILDMVPVTEVPNSRPSIGGLINVRGKVVPLCDLGPRLGMDCRSPTIDTRIVVLDIRLDDEPLSIAIVVDKVFDVTQIAAAAMEEAPSIGLKVRKEFIHGIGKRAQQFIIVLNIERLFATADSTAMPAAGDRH
jgi:purine-binding chemotaxis protein CheW